MPNKKKTAGIPQRAGKRSLEQYWLVRYPANKDRRLRRAIRHALKIGGEAWLPRLFPVAEKQIEQVVGAVSHEQRSRWKRARGRRKEVSK